MNFDDVKYRYNAKMISPMSSTEAIIKKAFSDSKGKD